jgi:hypothetical protein
MDQTAKYYKYESGEGDLEEDEEDSVGSHQKNSNQREEITLDGGSDRKGEEAMMKR